MAPAAFYAYQAARSETCVIARLAASVSFDSTEYVRSYAMLKVGTSEGGAVETR